MYLVGKIVKAFIDFASRRDNPYCDVSLAQKEQFFRLIKTARNTEFGKHYSFSDLVNLPFEKAYDRFRTQIPIYDYSKMYKEWWYMTLEGVPDVTWIGKIKYFALSSGTTEGPSKYIPVSKQMLKAIRKGSLRVMYSLPLYNLPDWYYQKDVLLLGGSTSMKPIGKGQYAGDLSGIMSADVPTWFNLFYKPPRKITAIKDWNKKIDAIVKNAHKWDVGTMVAVPPWAQLLLERIVEHYKIENIHQIWSHFSVLVFGGLSFKPYEKTFESLLGKPIITIETYLASEGYVAYQARPNARGLRLLADNGIFFEFVPFNSDNFDEEGNVKPGAHALWWEEVRENVDYAILLNTCAGSWRYLLGDTVKIVDKEGGEIIITGRTKHYLSVTGEHLSVENMSMAVDQLAEQLQVAIPEFTVYPYRVGRFWAHKWFLGTTRQINIPSEELSQMLDEILKRLNDDYTTERSSALKEIKVFALPVKTFYQWMEQRGKLGAQNKFPRVLKGEQIEQWEEFLKTQGLIPDDGNA
ncbi:MAG: GH3 auxin-responsive promoter family protein [Chlorobi bacterium]|nr:GH3 auxin-responsive promoter family protein [Chlorobiota bacterium]